MNSSSRLPQLTNKVSNERLTSVGSVTRGQQTAKGTPFTSFFDFTLDNSGGSTAKKYILFDALGLVKGIQDWTLDTDVFKPNGTSAPSYDALIDSLKANPVITSAYHYNITSGSAAQFSSKFTYYRGTIGGQLSMEPVYPQTGIRNTQQNDKVLTVEQEFQLDSHAAIVIEVAANTSVVIGFNVAAQLNVM